jgi:hypothetical protein
MRTQIKSSPFEAEIATVHGQEEWKLHVLIQFMPILKADRSTHTCAM